MRVVPEFRSDEQLLALDDRRDNLLQRTADLILILVHSRKIKMPVSMADSDFNLIRVSLSLVRPMATSYRVLDFMGFGEPGPETNLGQGVAVGQGEDLPKGHDR